MEAIGPFQFGEESGGCDFPEWEKNKKGMVLIMCSCGKHARFSSECIYSETFSTKEEGKKILRRLYEEQLINIEEEVTLFKELEKSSLEE